MIRFLLRLCGALSLAAGVAALVVDGTRSVGASHLVVTSVQQSLLWLGPLGWGAVQGAPGSSSALLRPVLATLAAVPTFVVLGGLGLLFLALGRPRVPGIGVVRR